MSGVSFFRNRFGWNELKLQPAVSGESEFDDVSVCSSNESAPIAPLTEIQNVVPVRSLPTDSKQNFTQPHFELQEDPSFWQDHNVQVIIRIRPLSNAELASQGHSRCIRQESAHSITWLGHPESRFTFDLVAGEKITQEKLFKVAGVPMVENCIGGYNSCMFAYGQTGSGKTHTMLGDIEDAEHNLSVNRGMTPRVFEHLFERIRKEENIRAKEKIKFACKCSFLEIYNEQIADLLDPSSTNLHVREDAKRGVHVENLTEVEVKGVNDIIRLLLQGQNNRKVAATNMNLASSRSHSVFTCSIESKWENQSVIHHRYGRLHLVDLAGSERQKTSGAEGERLKEATNINKSLSTLGLVIMNLVNISNGKPQHVPYRDSKLTFLLQDSLGGNSKTIIIANVSPSNCCSMETFSTLKFAQRAKFIRNNATVNENATGDVLTLKTQIQQLKEENNRLRGQLRDFNSQEDANHSRSWHTNSLESPLFGPRKGPQQSDLEIALHGALKRTQSMDLTVKALSAENECLRSLLKKWEEEAQSKNMVMRFREEKIRRLENVVSDKLSAETHLLMERKELTEELELAKARLTRNPEVTRFAMENIRLREQLRRYEDLYDPEECEQLQRQIDALEKQLFEALEWKFITGPNASITNKKEQDENRELLPPSNGGTEALLRQVQQYRKEADFLRNNLSFCIDAKEKLERQVEDLMVENERLKTSDTGKTGAINSEIHGNEMQDEAPLKDGHSTQKDLKDLVEAISAASQREAEAQGTVIHLARERDDLRKRLKESVEDNERLIGMYENCLQEREELMKQDKDLKASLQNAKEQISLLNKEIEDLKRKDEHEKSSFRSDESFASDGCQDDLSAVNRSKIAELESKLQHISEEKERLSEQYQESMERLKQSEESIEKLKQSESIRVSEDLTRVGNSAAEGTDNGLMQQVQDGQTEREITQLRMEVEEFKMKLKGTLEENERLIDMYEEAMQEKDNVKKLLEEGAQNKASPNKNINSITSEEDEIESKNQGSNPCSSINCGEQLKGSSVIQEEKLAEVIELVECLCSLEKDHADMANLRQQIDIKGDKISSLQTLLDELLSKKERVTNKLNAAKILMSSTCAPEDIWKARIQNPCLQVKSSISSEIDRKVEQMSSLQAERKSTEVALARTVEMEAATEAEVSSLTEKLQHADRQRIDMEKAVSYVRSSSELLSMQLGPAASLLKGEEDRSNLSYALKTCSALLKTHKERKNMLEGQLMQLDFSIDALQSEIDLLSMTLKEPDLTPDQFSTGEQLFTAFEAEGGTDVDKLVVELHSVEFEILCKEEELKSHKDDLQCLTANLAEIENRCKTRTDEQQSNPCLLSQKLLTKIKNMNTCMSETEADTSLASLLQKLSLSE